MSNVWVEGARPKTLSAAILPVFLGTAAAFNESFSILPAVLALIVAFALQIGVNYANDYSDGIKGSDGESRSGPARLVGSGLVPPEKVLRAAIFMFTLSAASGLWLSLISTLWLIPIGMVCISAAWFYTGGSAPYGYKALGEVSVFIFFGLVGTNGSFFVQVERFSLLAFILSCIAGLLSCGLMMINNLRDYQNDSAVGKQTLIVLLGENMSKKLFSVIISTSLLLGVLVSFWHLWALIVLASVPLVFKILKIVNEAKDSKTWARALRQMGILQILVAALLSASLVITG
ncbi:MAG: 1,4-dihydroxy-2-naphthoate polyprenyltransferase [Acidimicrobiaceae bacterium]|nr:1,4-dihydroxy-2-naphthoate polyprenyltransferase [Acidimicrobiaceae bacterium]|tara:strand:- start:9506 stop:10372 length:867 start_codon:yes stop_codon:yes gene_type:complete